MRGVRRVERLFHMAVKQATKPREDRELHQQWVDYLYAVNEQLGYVRTRHWGWDEEVTG